MIFGVRNLGGGERKKEKKKTMFVEKNEKIKATQGSLLAQKNKGILCPSPFQENKIKQEENCT